VLFIGGNKLSLAADGELVIGGSVNILGDIKVSGDLEVNGDILGKSLTVEKTLKKHRRSALLLISLIGPIRHIRLI